jgi:hypothetical protein
MTLKSDGVSKCRVQKGQTSTYPNQKKTQLKCTASAHESESLQLANVGLLVDL